MRIIRIGRPTVIDGDRLVPPGARIEKVRSTVERLLFDLCLQVLRRNAPVISELRQSSVISEDVRQPGIRDRLSTQLRRQVRRDGERGRVLSRVAVRRPDDHVHGASMDHLETF